MIHERCKEIGIRRVNFQLTPKEIASRLLGTKTYRKTKYLAINNGTRWAIARVRTEKLGKSTLRKIKRLKIISLPRETGFLSSETIDVTNPSKMQAALASQQKKFLIVKGRYEHISFVSGRSQVCIEVIDVYPPPHPHLIELAHIAVENGLVKQPVLIREKIINLNTIARKAGKAKVMFPCNCSGISKKGTLFLNRCPKLSQSVKKELVLVGCNRSEKIFNDVYSFKPKRISMCPKDMVRQFSTHNPLLYRCCESKTKVHVLGQTAVVPWDARIEQVAKAINILAKKCISKQTGAKF